MTQDGVIVQPGDASPTGNEGGATSTTVEAPPKAEPSMEERLAETNRQLEEVRAELAKGKEALTKQTQNALRELQSYKDKSIAEQKRAAVADRASEASLSILREIDPERVKDVELVRYKAEKEVEKTHNEESQKAELAQQFSVAYEQTLQELAEEHGVDPTDKRIDWATDETNLVTRIRRLNKSLGAIRKANAAELAKQKEKEAEDKVRRKYGLDSVDTSGGGVTANGTWLKQWVSGELPATKDNIRKAEKLLNS